MYAQAVQAIKRRQAEDIYLAPVGLNVDTFLAQQKEMSDEAVASLTAQMQGYMGDDVEALVVASNGADVELFHIDLKGTVRSFDDVGFAAIGIGASHARLSLMQAGYVRMARLDEALAFTYAAKKAAEVAPGVGQFTDMNLVFRDGSIRVWPNVYENLERIYRDYAAGQRGLVLESIAQLRAAIYGVNKEQSVTNDAGDKAAVGQDAATDESARSDAAEGTRTDEVGPEKGQPS
jgi:hypothetical protein